MKLEEHPSVIAHRNRGADPVDPPAIDEIRDWFKGAGADHVGFVSIDREPIKQTPTSQLSAPSKSGMARLKFTTDTSVKQTYASPPIREAG